MLLPSPVRAVALALAATLLSSGPTARAASVAPVAAERGMVVTAHALATQVGVDVLKRGGNAIDAAVAVGYALAVVYPAAGNLGGGGFMTLHLAAGPHAGQQRFIDFRETAPGAAQPGMYLGPDGQVVPGRSTRGWLAVGVPGSVAGLEWARERYGRWPRAPLIAPAIRLAERGFLLDAGDVDLLQPALPDLLRDAASAAVFTPPQGRAAWQPGDRLVQADLGRTLRAVARHGAAGFYAGPVGAALLRSSAQGGGVLSASDLAGYRALERAPVRCRYRGLEVVSAPPPSSGGVVLCQMLQVLQGYPLGAWGFRSAQGVHVQIEAMRHAYFDRNTLLGDPAFVDNPVAPLTDPTYADGIRAAIESGRAGRSADLRAGHAPHPLRPADGSPSVAPPREGQNTTHYSIVDAEGNAVSVTTTLNDWFGARVMAAGTGVLLNNEMDDFTAKPGVPNLFGLVQGTANAIAPGKRPLSSMSPTVVLKDGAPLLVLGSPGGSRIITGVLHTLLNVVDYGMTLQEAVDAPRFHQQWLPEATQRERFAFSPDTEALLKSWGHRFTDQAPAGHLAAVMVGAPRLLPPPAAASGVASGAAPDPLAARAGPARGRVFGANDPRRGTGLALGH